MYNESVSLITYTTYDLFWIWTDYSKNNESNKALSKPAFITNGQTQWPEEGCLASKNAENKTKDCISQQNTKFRFAWQHILPFTYMYIIQMIMFLRSSNILMWPCSESSEFVSVNVNKIFRVRRYYCWHAVRVLERGKGWLIEKVTYQLNWTRNFARQSAFCRQFSYFTGQLYKNTNGKFDHVKA